MPSGLQEGMQAARKSQIDAPKRARLQERRGGAGDWCRWSRRQALAVGAARAL